MDVLRIIPLGGLGEIGRNMMVFEYGNDIVIVDAGFMFPPEDMLGIDFIIPNTKYLDDKKKNIRGIIITHGHEDHIGALPFVLPRLGNPIIYTSPLAKGLIEIKMEEFKISPPRIEVIKPEQKIKLGVFEFEPFEVNHSIPDTYGLIINTPVGNLVHSGDFKIDFTPVSGNPINLSKLIQAGEKGVLALFSDSTNAESPGYTLSEKNVGENIMKIMSRAEGRVVVASFASLINRIQQVFDASVKYNRKIFLSGRSLLKTVEVSSRLGYLRVPKDLIVDVRGLKNLRDDQVTIMCTGSQGEMYSALVRMAAGDHQHVQIKPGDTVLISASPIPGNESAINKTINNLFRRGAEVIYGKGLDIHVSGHASQEELKLVHQIVKPKYFIPVHGEDRHLILHCRLAQSMGHVPQNMFALEDGMVLEIDKDQNAKVRREMVPAGYVLVDGLGVGDVGDVVLRDRQAMSKEGMFMIVCVVDPQTGELVSSPDIISRGFVYMRAHEDLIQQARNLVRKIMLDYSRKRPQDWNQVKIDLREKIGDFLFEKTQRRPLVLPVIIES
ncbi:MAG: ribonuclease J [Patescibacteria group bacterium]|nr:ribonuclease J [Patescibacteria group bacterium]